jgi:hypothetical protein
LGSAPAYFRIDTNPSTGYSLIVDDTVVKGIFTFSSLYEPFASYDPSNPINGAGGTSLFQLSGIAAGSGVFRVAYARPWEYDGNWDAYTGIKYTFNIGYTI